MENNENLERKNTVIELDSDPVKREFIDDTMEFPQEKNEATTNLSSERLVQSGNITF